MIAVEHIQPKSLPQFGHLINEWTNFLLACVNCNSAKGDIAVDPANYYLPDRDNTFLAFSYLDDGRVQPNPALANPAQHAIAEDMIGLVALNRSSHANWTDPGLPQAALERLGQRLAVWITARDSLADLQRNACDEVRSCIVRTALATGFFSIWMDVFAAHPNMRERFIAAFPGTARNCFQHGTPIPRPGGRP
jgi:hypothetical protein